MLQGWGVLYILISTCAPQRGALFRHLNFQKLRCFVHFDFQMWCNFSSFIWPAGSAPPALASLLFDPPEPQINAKTQCFAASYLFTRPLFSLLTFSISHLLLSDFCTSEFLPGSASSWLCFSTVHIVGTLVLKLPSIIYTYTHTHTHTHAHTRTHTHIYTYIYIFI